MLGSEDLGAGHGEILEAVVIAEEETVLNRTILHNRRRNAIHHLGGDVFGLYLGQALTQMIAIAIRQVF